MALSQTQCGISVRLELPGALTYLFMLACAISATYWIMKIIQIPEVPGQSANGIPKGMNLYTNQDVGTAYTLFGSKPIATENIYYVVL